MYKQLHQINMSTELKSEVNMIDWSIVVVKDIAIRRTKSRYAQTLLYIA
jgi:hypothetical protein